MQLCNGISVSWGFWSSQGAIHRGSDSVPERRGPEHTVRESDPAHLPTILEGLWPHSGDKSQTSLLDKGSGKNRESSVFGDVRAGLPASKMDSMLLKEQHIKITHMVKFP